MVDPAIDFELKRRLPPQEPEGGVVPFSDMMLLATIAPNEPFPAPPSKLIPTVPLPWIVLPTIGIVGRLVVIDAVIAVLITEVPDDQVVVRTRTIGIPVIQIDPGVLVAVDEVVDDGVIAAAGQLDPGGIRLDQREILIGSIVADQVMVAADYADPNTGVVIRDVVGDCGVAGVPGINALLIRVAL